VAKVQKSSYPVFEEGTYEICSLEFFTKDDKGSPIFVTQETKYGVRMVARYRTLDAQKNEGPPGSVDPDGVALLVHAFGGDASLLPKGDDLRALSMAERLIKDADKTVKVYVNDSGWIRRVQGTNLPVGKYLFKPERIATVDEDGRATWREGDYGSFSTAAMTVFSNADGSPSPFDGSGATLWLNKKSFAIMRALAPDATEAILGPVEDELFHLQEMFQATDKWLIYGEVDIPPKGERPKLLAQTLEPIAKDSISAKKSTTGGDGKEPSYIRHLYQAIADGADGKAFTPNGSLSDAGKKWCGTNLRPLCTEHDIPNKFDQMTEENVVTLLKSLDRNDLVDLVTGVEEVYEEPDW